MIKRIVSMILSIAVLSLSFYAVSAKKEMIYENQNVNYNRLKSMGVINFEESQLKDYVSRAQVAVATANIFSNNSENFPVNVFYDVPADNVSSGAIGFVYSKGIMSGDGSGNFRPDDFITFNEVAKILMSVTGYSYVAEQQGGYSIGYLNAAAAQGVTNNITIGSTEKVTMADFCNMLYKALEIPVMEKSLRNNEEKYEINNNHNLISDILERQNLSFNTGILVSDGITGIHGNGEVKKGFVKIDDSVIQNSKINVTKYLGMRIEYWCYKDGNNVELTSLYPIKGNRTVSYDVEDIVSASFDRYEVRDDSDKILKENLNTDAFSLVYNGEGVASITENMLMPKNGKIELLDNNDDGLYDVVFIDEYDTYLLEETGANGYNLYFKDIGLGSETGLFVNIDDKDTYYNVYNEAGEKVDPIELGKNQIVQVSKSKSGKIITVCFSKSKIDGAIEGISQDEGIITINSGDYELERLYNGSYPTFEMGKSGMFYVNTSGKIVYFEESVSSQDNYGYVEKMATEKGLSGTVQLRIVTAGTLGTAQGKWYYWVKDKFVQNADIVVFNMASSVEVDGVSIKSPKIDDVSKYLFQTIKYTLDSKGNIKTIKTLTPNFVMKAAKFNHETQAMVTTDENDYTDDIQQAILLVGNIKCLAIPSKAQVSSGEYTDEEILAKYRIENDSSEHYISVYDMPEDSQTPRFITMSTELNKDGNMFKGIENYAIVRKISKITDGNDEAYKITYMQGGSERYATVEPSVSVSGIRSSIDNVVGGDIVFLTERYNGTIGDIQVIESLKESRSLGVNDDNDRVYGGVTKIKTGLIWEQKNDMLYNFIGLNFGSTNGTLVVPSDLIIYRYIKSNNNISVVDLKSLKGGVGELSGDKIFAITSNNAAKFAVVIE